MILPTIIGVSESAIRAVPGSYYEGSLALGATHERSVFRAVLPAAKSGIFAGIILGVGRAIGETMAVIMVAGNQARVPKGILKGVRTLTANIVMEMGYAEGLQDNINEDAERSVNCNRCCVIRVYPYYQPCIFYYKNAFRKRVDRR